MTNEELNTALYEKMFSEQETYRAWLLAQPPEEILNHTYEYTVREDILMSLEYNRDAGRRFFGMKSAKKEIGKHLEKLKFREFQQGDALRQELLYKECCHMVKTYMELCEKDKNYNTIICGIVPIGEKGAKNKLQVDIYETAVQLPVNLDMQEELGIITRAAREAYEKHFPGEGGLDAKTGK